MAGAGSAVAQGDPPTGPAPVVTGGSGTSDDRPGNQRDRLQSTLDSLAALAAVWRLRPVAVVLDVGLPGMDDIDVCRTIRANDDWTPVLFVTAHARSEAA